MEKENAKYVKGEPIRSLDELMAQELICFDNKIHHRGLPILKPEYEEVDSADKLYNGKTERADKGFGSSGKF
jgi:hypothetical protein